MRGGGGEGEVTIRNAAGLEEVEPFYWSVNGNTTWEMCNHYIQTALFANRGDDYAP